MSFAVQRFQHHVELIDDFSRRICRRLEEAVNERGEAFLVVSGGSTPLPLFKRLAQQVLPWPKITILLADERWVPATDVASNEKMVREQLLQGQAAAANFVSLLTDDADAFAGEAAVQQRLADLPTFDVVILGMGEDGHTASLFPDSPQLATGMTTSLPAIAVTTPSQPQQRLSLSKQRLLDSRQIYFHLVGPSKAATLERAQQQNLPANDFLQQQQTPVTVMLAEQ
ncbi:6-phosphogluconolactonase [Pseudidiomarina salilacus]|uniref:6-phosphogluconolactonase n=1 Tax=Pseudidiomarina salilacus TaxID=3384452 RepID=UPI00398529F6